MHIHCTRIQHLPLLFTLQTLRILPHNILQVHLFCRNNHDHLHLAHCSKTYNRHTLFNILSHIIIIFLYLFSIHLMFLLQSSRKGIHESTEHSSSFDRISYNLLRILTLLRTKFLPHLLDLTKQEIKFVFHCYFHVYKTMGRMVNPAP